MTTSSENPTPTPPGRVRLPSMRAGVLLAAVMLGLGVLIGAAFGPAPDASLAGGGKVPLILSSLEARARAAAAASAAAASASTAAAEPPAVTPEATPAAAKHRKAAGAAATTESEKQAGSGSEPEAKSNKKTSAKKLPAITSVWLIELAGSGFEAAQAQAAAAPYIDTQLLPAATLLSGYSSLQAAAFATDAALAEPPAAGAVPPLLHTIVQPPCPEGTAGAACAAETPGQLTTADEFLKATLATITGTALYREHGLIVVTFASVGLASQAELPAGTSTATLNYQPPAGAALLSPFAKAGLRSKASFNADSPRQSLEALLH